MVFSDFVLLGNILHILRNILPLFIIVINGSEIHLRLDLIKSRARINYFICPQIVVCTNSKILNLNFVQIKHVGFPLLHNFSIYRIILFKYTRYKVLKSLYNVQKSIPTPWYWVFWLVNSNCHPDGHCLVIWMFFFLFSGPTLVQLFSASKV